MSKIVVDAELGAKLAEAAGMLEVCDPSGRILGSFYPIPWPPGAKSLKDLSPYSDEEIEEFRKEKGGRPLREIWKDLDGEGGDQ